MRKAFIKQTTILVAASVISSAAIAETYGPYPITLKGYEGDKTNSVSYGGQVARQTLEQSLKSLAGKGDGSNAAELEAQMLSYLSGPAKDLAIVAPAGKDGFPIKQTSVGELSGSANLEGKFYKGLMPAWPGNMTGLDVVKDMIARAAASTSGGSSGCGRLCSSASSSSSRIAHPGVHQARAQRRPRALDELAHVHVRRAEHGGHVAVG